MYRAGMIGLSLAMLVACGAYGVSARASEVCHRPAPLTLIHWYNATHPGKPLRYSPDNSAIYHPISIFYSERPPLNWIGLAWLSPVWGALFAVNCDGNPLSAVSKGAIGKLAAGPVLSALGQTVMFEYVDHETADCVHDSIGIAAIKDGKIISLWEHGYNQGVDVAGSGKPLMDFITKKYALRFDDNGQTIRITGNILTYPYLKNGSQSPTPAAMKELQAETYHWDAKSLRFLPERHYSRPAPCTVAG